MKAKKVIVSVRGGVAYLEKKPKGVKIAIIDYDVDGADRGGLQRDRYGELCAVTKYDAKVGFNFMKK